MENELAREMLKELRLDTEKWFKEMEKEIYMEETQ